MVPTLNLLFFSGNCKNLASVSNVSKNPIPSILRAFCSISDEQEHNAAGSAALRERSS